MIVEVVEFTVHDTAVFGALNDSYQEAVAYQSEGLMRRTVARSEYGTWVDIRLWADGSPAEMSGDSSVRAAYDSAVSVLAARSYRGL
ncbi:MAG: hypothetical protein ACKODP_04465 [Actinomycetota bacterium]